MIRKAQTIALMTAVYSSLAFGQTPSAATLVVGLENVVEYQVDVADLSKWGTNPNSTPGKILQGMGVGCAGVPAVVYGDIVSVNGDPARGTYVARATSTCMSPTPTAGLNMIGDVAANSLRDETYYILERDGVTAIGTIMVNGLNGSVVPKPPGPPAGRISRLWAAQAHSSGRAVKKAAGTAALPVSVQLRSLKTQPTAGKTAEGRVPSRSM